MVTVVVPIVSSKVREELHGGHSWVLSYDLQQLGTGIDNSVFSLLFLPHSEMDVDIQTYMKEA